MKIFVAYGYNDRDRWIPDLVFPVIEAFGDEVITGEELQGQRITPGVIERIQNSHALIGFTTRRDPIDNNRWLTHRWVTDEISQAIALGLDRVLEVREEGVDDQGGIAGDRQRIRYAENSRDRCIVALVETLGNWHRVHDVRLQLLPQESVREIYRLLKNPNLRCTYQWMEGFTESEKFPTRILRIDQGLFIVARNIPSSSLVAIQVECDGQSWTSDFRNTDALGINLQKDE